MRDVTIQVISMDKKGYILRYRDFNWNDMPKMLEYIQLEIIRDEVNFLDIKKWNRMTGDRV